MARICTLCEKCGNTAGGYSNRVRATEFNPTGKRRQQPNLQWATFPDGTRSKVCTRCKKKGKHLIQKAA